MQQNIRGFCFLGLIILFSTSLYSQWATIDFDSPTDAFIPFGGSSFQIQQDTAGNSVGRLDNSGQAYEGVYNSLQDSVGLDSLKVISVNIYSSDAASHTLRIKLEDPSNTDVKADQIFQGIGWHTLNFDFSQATLANSGNNVPINATGSFSVMTLFVDGPQSQSGTYLIDDINYPTQSGGFSLDIIYSDLIWSDEFDYNGSPDSLKWFHQTIPPNSTGWHNGEKQHYTSRLDNSYVSNGNLHIVAKSETYSDGGLTKNYTSARLNGLFDFTYGRIDIRAKLPVGDGTWPALWMMGISRGNSQYPQTLPWPDCGEIDIMEHWGNEPNKIHGSIHNPNSFGGTSYSGKKTLNDVSNSFHVYSVNWSPNKIAFLIDEEIYYIYNPGLKDANSWPFDDPQFLLMNVAMGSNFHPIDPNFIESEMLVDYVRVYQNVVGLSEQNLESNLLVYPQPVSHEVTISADRIERIVIYNTLGQQFLNARKAGSEIHLDVKSWPRGQYFVRVWNGQYWSTAPMTII